MRGSSTIYFFCINDLINQIGSDQDQINIFEPCARKQILDLYVAQGFFHLLYNYDKTFY